MTADRCLLKGIYLENGSLKETEKVDMSESRKRRRGEKEIDREK